MRHGPKDDLIDSAALVGKMKLNINLLRAGSGDFN
jgi:hypothetical protein